MKCTCVHVWFDSKASIIISLQLIVFGAHGLGQSVLQAIDLECKKAAQKLGKSIAKS